MNNSYKIKKAEIEVDCHCRSNVWKEIDVIIDNPPINLQKDLEKLDLPDGRYKITLIIEKK